MYISLNCKLQATNVSIIEIRNDEHCGGFFFIKMLQMPTGIEKKSKWKGRRVNRWFFLNSQKIKKNKNLRFLQHTITLWREYNFRKSWSNFEFKSTFYLEPLFSSNASIFQFISDDNDFYFESYFYLMHAYTNWWWKFSSIRKEKLKKNLKLKTSYALLPTTYIEFSMMMGILQNQVFAAIFRCCQFILKVFLFSLVIGV